MTIGSPEIKVGALVLIVSLMVATFSLSLREGPGLMAATRRHHFDLNDAAGLVKGSAVKMAGVRVGIIKKIELVAGKARVFLILDEDVPITSTTQIEIRTRGILGDKHVEIVNNNNTEPGEVLASGQAIQVTSDNSSFNILLKDIGKLVKSLDQVATNLNAATQNDGDKSSPLGRIVLNVEHLTEDLKKISGQNKSKFHNIMSKLENIVGQVEDLVDEDVISAVNSSLTNIEEVTEKINNGDGTIARLINDGETVDSLNDAIEGVNDLLGGFKKFETNMDVHSAYTSQLGRFRTTILVQLVPGLDRYYELGIVTSPEGMEKVDVERRTYPNDRVTEIETSRRMKNQILFNALFAKRFHNLTVKGGVINSTSGVALDYHFLQRKLSLSAEAFRLYDPVWKTYFRYNFSNGFYFMGGGENLFGPNPSTLIGIGLWLRNDDIKMFASQLSF